MISITSNYVNVSASGPTVYLDNCALYDIAEKDPAIRKRFIKAVHSGVDVLFSVTNVAELCGPMGRSAEVVRGFLDEIGPHWFPAKLDVTTVMRDELRGIRPEEACIDKEFFKSHVADQIRLQAEGGKIIGVSDAMFRLGPVLDRVGPQRDSIVRSSAEFDEIIKSRMLRASEEAKRDPASLDRKFPVVAFHPSQRASFVYRNLLRIMASDAGSLKKGDSMDFCHAVIACAFGSFAVLDTRWKHGLSKLPPNPFARIYSPSELDKMVADMESHLN